MTSKDGIGDTAERGGAGVPEPARGAAPARFGFTHRFGLLAFACVFVVGAGSAAFLSRMTAERTIRHDANEVMQFIQSFTPAPLAQEWFAATGERARDATAIAPFLERVAAMPDVIHVNVYDARRSVRWSTKPEMIGKVLPVNHELDEAFAGELAVESSLLEDRNYLKPEHVYLRGEEDRFVETYVPIWSLQHSEVVGVIEIYRSPTALLEMTRDLIEAVWASAAIGGLFLFAALYWLARRADRLIGAQQRALVESETLATVGEMSTAVAHSIRNPLASIRSSAELARELEGDAMRSAAGDIISQVDRIAAWITQLLVYAQPGAPKVGRVELLPLVREVVQDFSRELAKRSIRVNVDAESPAPGVLGDRALLAQVLNTLLSNAMEAMPDGGDIDIDLRSAEGGKVQLRVRDSGEGIPPEQLQRIFVPYRSTKKSGLGVGLPLVRRVLSRLGGTVEVESTPGLGTVFHLQFERSDR